MEDLQDVVKGLENTDLEVLEELRKGGSTTPTGVAVRLDVEKSAVETVLARLRDRGLVLITPLKGTYDKELYRLSNTGQSVLNLTKEYAHGTLANLG